MTLIKKILKDLKQDTSRPNYKPDPRRATRTKCKIHGHIPGIVPGTTFMSKKACSDAGVHGAPLQGIHGSPTGAYSVCLSGIYEEDKDDGDSFVYTGTGGKENAYNRSSKHVGDQSFANPSNKSLKMSVVSKLPVRVVRGPIENSKWAPTSGYRYDGLYQVVKAYYGRCGSGRRVCKFNFRRLPSKSDLKST